MAKMKVNELVDWVDFNDGDIIAIDSNQTEGKINIAGVAGSTDDFDEKDFLCKGKYILFKAIDTKEIK